MSGASYSPDRRPLHPELLAGIPPEWHGALADFLEIGEASDAFLAFLDSSPAAQAVCETVAEAQAREVAAPLGELIERGGGPRAVAEHLGENGETSLDRALHVTAGMVRRLEEMRREQREIDAVGGTSEDGRD